MKETTDESQRPWGSYLVLADEPGHKVKRITVLPGHRLSLQRHQKRSEHWFCLEGVGIVTLDESRIDFTAGKAVDIPCGAKHRIENTGAVPVEFIEVQTGSYFGEDDIERIEDDYKRV